MSEDRLEVIGVAVEWDDDEIDIMADITAAVLADARVDAMKYLELWQFLNAPEVD